MIILAIETSCDDTCISILKMSARDGKVLANSTNSQIPIHIPHGGVYPILAKREHAKNLPILLNVAIHKARNSRERSLGSRGGGGQRKFSAENFCAESTGISRFVNLIAVTHGPGLEMCLWEGITFAKDLAKKWQVPLIPVNHMEGHILSVFGKREGKFSIRHSTGAFPALSLLVSGGHTQLVLMKKNMQYEIIGETLDDAVGEAFDKVARMLDLPYPGGPEISKLAEELRAKKHISKIKFPRPMLHSKNLDFSFSGLKTSVLYFTQKNKSFRKSEVALEFENAVIETLIHKTKKAIEKYNVKTLIVAGGVACNTHLQREMKRLIDKKVKILLPAKDLAGDNAIMISIAGYLNYLKNKKKVPKPESIKAIGKLRL